LYGLFWGGFSASSLIIIALAAYAAYIINAGQFLWKLRAARLQSEATA
jgi:3-vinyl bacteriochlorophyllide hydratase